VIINAFASTRKDTDITPLNENSFPAASQINVTFRYVLLYFIRKYAFTKLLMGLYILPREAPAFGHILLIAEECLGNGYSRPVGHNLHRKFYPDTANLRQLTNM
jgi:hypothetical protein